MQTSPKQPHVVVLANHKGGSGKSTLAMHIIVAFLKAGRRVGAIDLDTDQRSLTRYVENRMDWSNRSKINLSVPDHSCIESVPSKTSANDSRISALLSRLEMMQRKNDLIVIDTAGGGGELNVFAHGLADTLITPINDSFLDLDVIDSRREGSPSPYTETVRKALEARRSVTKRTTDWVVVRNRLSPLSSRNQRDVLYALERIASQAGFRVASGLLERVVYRQFFPTGLTAFDTLEASTLGIKPTLSHLIARMEVRALLSSLLLFPQEDGGNEHPLAPNLEPPGAEPDLNGMDVQAAIRTLLNSRN